MIRVFNETNADFASEQDDWHLTTAIAFWWQPDAASEASKASRESRILLRVARTELQTWSH